jgi:glycosyltransferase involved in cell wall biosynthesis
VNLATKNILSQLTNQDIVYLRNPYPFFEVSRIMRKSRGCKIVIEYQTIEPLEFRLNRKYWYLFLDFLFGNSIRHYSDAIVGVTNEITQYQLKRCEYHDKPHITVGNGIDVASVPLKHYTSQTVHNLHLLFVANVSRWHGIDRLALGLANYDGPINITLHIAGKGAELPNLNRLIKDCKISEKIIFHGFTAGAALDNLFNTCHIAVGSLGIHRIGLTESSTLKVREYCARGIPWIIACKDPDFPDDFPYIHRIPADESPVRIEEVIEFAKRVYADPDHPQKMREYAVEHLDWSVKMKKLKAFLESLVEESPSEA